MQSVSVVVSPCWAAGRPRADRWTERQGCFGPGRPAQPLSPRGSCCPGKPSPSASRRDHLHCSVQAVAGKLLAVAPSFHAQASKLASRFVLDHGGRGRAKIDREQDAVTWRNPRAMDADVKIESVLAGCGFKIPTSCLLDLVVRTILISTRGPGMVDRRTTLSR
jgi:hypothetical protein